MKAPSLLAITAVGLSGLCAFAADTSAPPPDIKILADEPFGGDPSGHSKLHTVVGITLWPVGGATKRHYHAGDEYAVVIEGAIEIDNDGQPPHIYHAGEAYHNARGVVHIARNASNGPSKLSFMLITDVGSQLQVPAN